MDGAAEAWQSDWPQTQESYPSGRVPILEADWVNGACQAIGMSPEVTQAFLRALPAYESNEALRRVVWHCHAAIFHPRDGQTPSLRRWPKPPQGLGEAGTMLYAIALLSGLPTAQRLHRERGIDESVTVETLQDFELWIREYRNKHGVWGFDEFGWIVRHFTGCLFSLGRLQFEITCFPFDFHVYRNHATGRVVALAGDGSQFRPDGQFADADGMKATKDVWTARFGDDGRVIRGNPISPLGAAMPDTIELKAEEWTPVLRKDDPTLSLHIPATGPMTHEGCGESLRRAMAFFPKHFPEFPFRAFTCVSWFLDNQFEQCLPSTSNIVRFQREVHLFPIPGATAHQTLERVFGGPIADLERAPQETSLQRVIIGHLKAGGHWRMGGCFLLPEDLNWGGQAYRNKAM